MAQSSGEDMKIYKVRVCSTKVCMKIGPSRASSDRCPRCVHCGGFAMVNPLWGGTYYWPQPVILLGTFQYENL